MCASEPSLALRHAVRYHCGAVAPESVPVRDPVLAVSDAAAGFAAYWRTADGTRLTAVGAVHEERFTGADAIAQAQRAWSELRGLLDGDAVARVRAFCGFAFAPQAERDAHWQAWPDGLLVLPEWLLWELPGGVRGAVRVTAVRRGQEQQWRPQAQASSAERPQSALTPTACKDARALAARSARAGSGTGEQTRALGRSAWCGSVADAAAAVREGRLDKVVLARREEWTAAQPIRVDVVLRTLERDYPEATVFAVRRGGQVFVGATPERLVALRSGEVAVDCLAGTARRGAVGGWTDGVPDGVRTQHAARAAAGDEDAARALLASVKDRVEHAAVVRGVEADLAPLVDGLETAAQPRVMRLKNVLHLYTPVRARSRAGVTVLTLLARLHPTAAVAGLPRRASLAAIERWETMDRGWYAAPIGWVDGDEEGEFVVALRSALIEGNRAMLYAGVGVVADSLPDAEWMETEWKLAPMRTAMQVADTASGPEASPR